MTRYVVGFLFSTSGKSVALIRKARPEWQKDRLNGIGGKIEPGETALQAMQREFREETGYREPLPWREYAVLHDARGWDITFFAAKASRDVLDALVGLPDEPIEIRDSYFLHYSVLPNLRWLVPLGLDPDVGLAVIREDSELTKKAAA